MQDKDKEIQSENLTGKFQDKGGGRNSSIELLRIVSMICIIAHHYVVNSGILEEITRENAMQFPSLFALLYGWGGKTGINCFVLITGYFMCKSNISVKKYLKILLEIEFYNIVIYLIFLGSGYEQVSIKTIIKSLLPIYELGTGFTSSYLVFYFFIPFLNFFIGAMNEKKHIALVFVCILTGIIPQTFLKTPAAFTYVGWFMVLYFIASYLRLYPKKVFSDRKLCGRMLCVFLILSWLSVIVCNYLYLLTGKRIQYFFVADSNKLLALGTAVAAFLFFKNLTIEYCHVINKMASAVFGVLMIHANSDTMRKWLWKDILKNTEAFHSNYFIFHAIGSVIGIYLICTGIELLRIQCMEKKFFQWYDDKKLEGKITALIRKFLY